jgi:hypothetical protein
VDASTLVLVAGYLLAVPFTLFVPGFLRMWRRREQWTWACAQGGAALIVLGWALRGDAPTALVNAAWLIGFGTAYWRAGRARDRAGAPGGRLGA